MNICTQCGCYGYHAEECREKIYVPPTKLPIATPSPTKETETPSSIIKSLCDIAKYPDDFDSSEIRTACYNAANELGELERSLNESKAEVEKWKLKRDEAKRIADKFITDNELLMQQNATLEEQNLSIKKEFANLSIHTGLMGQGATCSGCNEAFVSASEIYRCAHCEHRFHKHCINKHFTNHSFA